YKYSNDERYFTNRIYNHINATGYLNNIINYNISVSYQFQERKNELFRYNITNDLELNNQKRIDKSMKVFYSSGSFNNIFKTNKFNMQLGYEIVNNYGFSIVDAEANIKKEVRKTINNYDVFAVSEISLTDNFSFRPGIRYSYQTQFKNQYSYSLGTRYLTLNNYELRAAIGKSYRTPNFDELYTRN